MGRRALAVILLVLVVVVAAACRPGPTYWRQDADETLNAKIIDLNNSESSMALKDLTEFEWDEVYIYDEGVSNDRINQDVGVVMFRPGDYMMISGVLAVFVLDGDPVRVLVLPSLEFKQGHHSADVILERGFELVEPAYATAMSGSTCPAGTLRPTATGRTGRPPARCPTGAYSRGDAGDVTGPLLDR